MAVNYEIRSERSVIETIEKIHRGFPDETSMIEAGLDWLDEHGSRLVAVRPDGMYIFRRES